MVRLETVVRIVVNGCPWEKAGRTNFAKAREMLNQALKSDGWPSERCLFVITPGGFIQARMPTTYRGNRGWHSRPQDFQDLIPAAQDAIDQVVTAKMKREFGRRAQFLTLGVDLMPPGQAKGTKVKGTSAELVAVIDLSTGLTCHWTGKSYPVGRQENTLVHETDLTSHCWYRKSRTLILGCHDLNAFSHRAQATAERPARVERWKALDRLAHELKPAIVLHHPHETDSPNIWSGGWSGIRQRLDSVRTYASGIAYFNQNQKPRQSLDSVLERTKCGAVVDIRVDGY